MTPLQIRMLLHYHCEAGPFDMAGPAQHEALEEFVRLDLVYVPLDDHRPRLTERGEAYVHFLTTLPLPVANWTIPGPWAPSMPPKVDE